MVSGVLIAVLCFSSWCLVVTIILLLTLMMPCVGLQCVIVVYLDHIHFLLVISSHVIAMVSPFQTVGNTKLIFILVKEIVLYTGKPSLEAPLIL